MKTTIVVAVITVTGSILGAAITFWLTKRAERIIAWQQQKLEYYQELLRSMSAVAMDNNNTEAAGHFAHAINTACLVGSQAVIVALMEFHDEIKVGNPNKTLARHDELLVKLMLAIRADIQLADKDDPLTFNFHLIAGPPSSKSNQRKKRSV